MKSRASVFKVILQDIEKEIGFDHNACAMMTEGYTPSDISALCGAAINSLLAEKKLTLQKEKKKERENSMKSDVNNSSKNSPKLSRISSRQLGLEVTIIIYFFLLSSSSIFVSSSLFFLFLCSSITILVIS